MSGDARCLGCMTDTSGVSPCPSCGWQERAEVENPLGLPPRTRLRDQYLIGRILGHGGFGITYLAWDELLDLKVAIKEYLPGKLATRAPDRATVTPFSAYQQHFDYGLAKFLEEARTLARFNEHPNIVSVLNFFRTGGTGYLVMNYVEGRTFKEFLQKREGRVPYELVARIAMPVLDALREVHAAGLLHRDISPDNVYLTQAGQVKLMDFGAARHATGEKSESLSVVLKPGYAPEEQYRTRGQQGPWTDVYAVGATMYRALTGQSPPESLDRKERDDLERPADLGIEMPAAAEAALLKAMAVRQEDRFQSVGEFQAALLAVDGQTIRSAADVEVASEPPPRPQPPSGPTTLFGADSPPAEAMGVAGALEPAADLAHRAAEAVASVVGRLPGDWRAPVRLDGGIRPVALGAAGLVALLGITWALSTLGATFANPMVGLFPGLSFISAITLLAGMAGNLGLLLGACLGFTEDRRAGVTIWGSAWFLMFLGVAGFGLYYVVVSVSPYWGLMDAFTRGTIVGAGLWPSLWGIAQAGGVAFLLRKAEGSAPARG